MSMPVTVCIHSLISPPLLMASVLACLCSTFIDVDYNFQHTSLKRSRMSTGSNFGNGTNPFGPFTGTAAELRAIIDQMIYTPEKKLNSRFPPTNYRTIRLSTPQAPLDLDVRVQLLPANDVPQIVGNKYDVNTTHFLLPGCLFVIFFVFGSSV